MFILQCLPSSICHICCRCVCLSACVSMSVTFICVAQLYPSRKPLFCVVYHSSMERMQCERSCQAFLKAFIASSAPLFTSTAAIATFSLCPLPLRAVPVGNKCVLPAYMHIYLFPLHSLSLHSISMICRYIAAGPILFVYLIF